MGLHIVITGNPVYGFKFFGPYPTRDDAIEAGQWFDNADWWVAPLEAL